MTEQHIRLTALVGNSVVHEIIELTFNGVRRPTSFVRAVETMLSDKEVNQIVITRIGSRGE